ncbi:MAG: carbohydrate ABC transporter substrate-binding protein [Butyrivibrio sp.]|nr:carbohydrate ABC transporter substrate-binding protein [Butyrivibrio sp.]
MKKKIAMLLAACMIFSVTACGETASTGDAPAETKQEDAKEASPEAVGNGELTYASVVLGESYTDLNTTITVFNHRTDMDSDDYGGVTWKEYLAEFNKMYPGINVEITTDTNYADDALTHLQSGDYETIMMIPHIDKADLSNYFMPYGTLDEMSKLVNYASQWSYDGMCYGVPSTATAQGIVYNKKVFADAGVTELPKTPSEFIDALKKIKENTDAIPLYTNYAAGWTMGAWDVYIGVNATGDSEYINRKLAHTKDPFKDYGDDTHAYAVYKILYDAVSEGLIEDDYTTTDWEGSKGMLNNGEIGCMVLGSWSYPQMEAAGPNAADIGYMPFPITVNGKQYSISAPDYNFGINANATEEEKEAAMVFIKWMTEKSGFYYNEDGLPIVVGNTETKLAFDGVEFLEDEPAVEGEEDFINLLNSDSELNINSGGNTKIQQLVEHAANKDKSFDDIMKEWNDAWTDAQELNSIEVTE